MTIQLSDTVERKFIDTIDIDDYEVLTDTGFKDIQCINKTIPYEVWKLKTEHHELKCADNHIVFLANKQEIFVKDLKQNDEILTKNGIERVISVESLGFKDNMYDISVHDDHHRYYSNDILSHNSESYIMFCLWNLCFYGATRIMLLAQEAKTAIGLLGRLRMAYEYLPTFLKPSIVTYNKSSIEFSTHAKMSAFATASQGARSNTADILIVDECAFVPNNIADAFMSSVYPTISRNKNSKIIFVSTPNGASDKNLFYHTWKSAGDSDPNDIYAWQRFRMDWWDVPGRDEQWKENQIKAIGQERFNQEFGNEFSGTGAIRLFSQSTFESLRQNMQKEAEIEIKMSSLANDHIWEIHAWQRPKLGHIYIAGADIAEGIGGDSSTLNIFDITDLSNIKQVLSFANSHISIAEFAGLCARILSCYNCPLLLAEANGVGSGFLSILNDHYKYSNILIFDDKLGIHSTPKNKMNACLWAKDVFNLYNIAIADEKTIAEMEVFSRTSAKTNPTYAALKGEHDDNVLALIWALYLLKKDVLEKQNRYSIIDTQKSSLGIDIVSNLIDNESLQDHFVMQFMDDPLKKELIAGTSHEITVSWWNSKDDAIVQMSQNSNSQSMPFFVINDNDWEIDADPMSEYGNWD